MLPSRKDISGAYGSMLPQSVCIQPLALDLPDGVFSTEHKKGCPGIGQKVDEYIQRVEIDLHGAFHPACSNTVGLTSDSICICGLFRRVQDHARQCRPPSCLNPSPDSQLCRLHTVTRPHNLKIAISVVHLWLSQHNEKHPCLFCLSCSISIHYGHLPTKHDIKMCACEARMPKRGG